jgi:hypothetical protein
MTRFARGGMLAGRAFGRGLRVCVVVENARHDLEGRMTERRMLDGGIAATTELGTEHLCERVGCEQYVS